MPTFYSANDSYNASLTADYTMGDATLSVSTLPENVPTIVTVARGTDKETRFYVTGAGSGLLTGVSRKEGADENISAGVSVECMIDDDFINQVEDAVFTQSGLKGLVYAADGGSNDTYAITLAVAPEAYSDIVGLPIAFKANTINTGAATLNVNSLGAKTIKKFNNEDLADGDIEAGQIVTVAYDGTNFQLLSQTANVIATGFKSATTSIDTSAATAPTAGQVLTAVDSDTAEWQTPNAASDGWISSSDTWVYASATTFTISGVDRTSVFTKGTRIKLTQTTAKYFVVVSSSFSTNTTVTITAGTDYSLANAAITSPFYSYQVNPQGYPTKFAYTPTVTATSGTITTASATGEFTISGNKLWMQASATITTNGTGSGAVKITTPVALSANSKYYVYGRNQSTGKMLYGQGESGNFEVRNYDNTYPGADSNSLSVQGEFIF